ncbi:hypothetical protein MMC09_003849 [Bachmanniomyces sp. S44760]|nr:hypothetical protein [Bachmanniomyces sp. S44760]
MQAYLSMPDDVFLSAAKDNTSICDFLATFVHEISRPNENRPGNSLGLATLRRNAYLLTHRLLSTVSPKSLLTREFLADFSLVYAKSKSLHGLFSKIWTIDYLDQNDEMQEDKRYLVRVLQQLKKKEIAWPDHYSAQIAALLKASHVYGRFLMVGSDLIDSLLEAWQTAVQDAKKPIFTITYRAIVSLLEGDKPNISLLLDHLYNFKSAAESNGSSSASLLSGIACQTPFVRRLRDQTKAADAKRARPLLEYLDRLRSVNDGTVRARPKRKIDKGKSNDRDGFGQGAFGNVHVHKISLITQLQDLFPDLGSGFIVKLLDEYDDDTEQVTAHLLDESLPAHLQDANRKEDLPNNPSSQPPASHLVPHSTPPLDPLPSRRNIHDDDSFSRLDISPSQVHQGRRDKTSSVLSTTNSSTNKAAILSALAAFDSDDDERDDTYDVEDVGGTVDTTSGFDTIANDPEGANNDEALYRAWKSNNKVFERDSGTRRGRERQLLRNETSMTDEGIEGWGIMVGRDPRRLKRLEARFGAFGGVSGQRELVGTRWREEADTEEENEEDGGTNGENIGSRGRGGSSGRGRRGERGRGNVAGPANDGTTQVARQKKDANKGSRANHNRRDQRARKMARGGGMAG